MIVVLLGFLLCIFELFKVLFKFFIVMVMGVIGININVSKLIKIGGKLIFLGVVCWLGIIIVSLIM